MKIHPLWLVCLLTRFFLLVIAGYVAKKQTNNVKLFFSVILYSIGIGFFIKSLSGKKKEVQISKVFWQDTRLVHSMLYILSGYYLYIGNYVICMILLGLDILFSVIYRLSKNK